MEYYTMDDSHPLLEPQSPSYSNSTIRRAFIVWLRCGQRNEFKDVCNYYHYLEALEEQLSAESRASSRHLEFSLFVSHPPTSPYQQLMFPQLYSSPYLDHTNSQAYINNYQFIPEQLKAEVKTNYLANAEAWRRDSEISPQEIFNASQLFKAPNDTINDDFALKKDVNNLWATISGEERKFNKSKLMTKKTDELKTVCKEKNNTKTKTDDKFLNGTSKADILETSEMIKNYCKEQQVPLKNFLENFKEYASRCQLTNTVNNVGSYIKRKMLQAELSLAVKVHRAKCCKGVEKKCEVKSVKSLKLEVPVIKEVKSDNNQNFLASLSKLTVNDDKVDSKNGLKTWSASNDDLITFDDRVIGINDKVIKVLRREESIQKNSKDFLNSHCIVKPKTQKCRKI